MKICAKCGTQCEDTMNFCSNCGASLTESTSADEYITEETAAATENVKEAAADSAETAADEAAAAAEDVMEAVSDRAEEKAAEASGAAEDIQAETAKAAESLFNAEAEGEAPLFEGAGVFADLPETENSEQPVITIEEDNSTVQMPEPQIKDAAQVPVEEAAEAAEVAGAAAAVSAAAVKEQTKNVPVQNSKKNKKKKSKSKKPISVLAVLSLIFALIGLFSGGYACLFTFMDFGTAAVFFIPSVIAVVLGLIALVGTGKEKPKRGKPLAIAGILIGVLSVVLWIVGAFFLHHLVKDKYGTEDLMSAIRAILSLR